MSIYALLEYVEDCMKKKIEPTFEELKEWKKSNWRD